MGSASSSHDAPVEFFLSLAWESLSVTVILQHSAVKYIIRITIDTGPMAWYTRSIVMQRCQLNAA